MKNIEFWKIVRRTVLVLILVAVVVALFTVPSAEKHQAALVPRYEKVMKDAVADESLRQQLEDSIMAVAEKGVNEGVDEGIQVAIDQYLSDPAICLAIATSTSKRKEVFEDVKQEVLQKVIEKTGAELKAYLSENTSSKVRTFVYGTMSKELQSSLTEAVINNKLETTDYYLFSVGSVEKDGTSRWLSFGIFGHVFTFDNAKLRKVLIGQ